MQGYNASAMKQPQVIALVAVVLVLAGVAFWFLRSGAPGTSVAGGDGKRVRAVLTGGHETDPVDRGRPVKLIAAALGVSDEVFRKAFSGVRPAPAGTSPDRNRVQQNKAALMAVLGPYGITNDRLDEVSDYYRYNGRRGELWRNKPAVVDALLENGAVTGFEIIDGGSGYSSPPQIAVPGFELAAEVQLSYGKQFETNGSISAVRLNRTKRK